MKMTIEVDCTPEEARRFLGLPDVSALNDHLVSELTKRIDQDLRRLSPEEFLKNWMGYVAGAQEQFRKLLQAGLSAATHRE
jgi:hypothetical protein